MENNPDRPLFPANWVVHFLCDCRKQNSYFNIHEGVAHGISTHGVRILSDHNICKQKRVAMQLMIPSVLAGVPSRIVKIIGKSIATVMQEGRFLTEIEFLHFEEDGLMELSKNLRLRFDPRFFV